MDTQKRYAVYGLFSTEDNRIRYIGQTSDALSRRMAVHRQEGRTKTSPVNRWIATVLASKHELKYVVLKNNAVLDADEIATIAKFREWVDDLLNIESGGRSGLSGKRSSEAKARMSVAQKGERNPRAKLTVSVVSEIKKLLDENELSQCDIGKRFNLKQPYISAIKCGRRWAFVQ